MKMYRYCKEPFLRADLWARRHAARFAPGKFGPIHFKNPNTEIHMEETQPSDFEPDPYDFAANHPIGNDLMAVSMPGRFEFKLIEYNIIVDLPYKNYTISTQKCYRTRDKEPQLTDGPPRANQTIVIWSHIYS